MSAVDLEQQPAFLPGGDINFEELLNMDIFARDASRASSHSPGSTLFSLPPTTPPQTDVLSSFAQDHPSLFAEIAKTMEQDVPLPPRMASSLSPDMASIPYELFGTVNGGGGMGTSSGPSVATASPSETTLSPSAPTFAIDPALMDSPAQPPHGTPDLEDDHGDDDDEELFAKPVKVGGKGKAAGRKGTVASGGVTKRAPGGKAVRDPDNAEEDDWRPSPEEYKKMSSKEKRQLRNKISARNFRVRRKEYITTLEGDIADRDSVIDAIREELGSTKLENVALRQEVEALKRAMLEGRTAPDTLPPPAPLAPATATTRTSRSSTASLLKPNTQKDLGSSPRGAASAFWGGSAMGGGVTPVHTTLVPDIALPFAQPPERLPRPDEQEENMNPALNMPCFGGVGVGVGAGLSSKASASPGSSFDAFTELNPFTLKTLDMYRMQLWTRMAREHGAASGPAAPPPPHASGFGVGSGPPVAGHQSAHGWGQSHPSLANALRPAFFKESSPSSPPPSKASPAPSHASAHSPLSALLSNKTLAASSLPSSSSPPSSPMPSFLPPTSPSPQHAALFTLASQTVLSKFSGALWDAFARSKRSGSAGAAEWDHDKVRRVLEGRAVLRVVDKEGDAALGLEESMRRMNLGAEKKKGL